MTLEELLKEHYKGVDCKKQPLDDCNKMFASVGCSKCQYNTHLTVEDNIPFLEELKSLRMEHEKNSKELEVYKKAFGLVCDELRNSGCFQEYFTDDCKLFCERYDVCNNNIIAELQKRGAEQ